MRVSRTLFFSAVVVAELAVGLASQPTVISAAPATAEEINNNYQTVRSTKDSLGHKIFAQQQIVAKMRMYTVFWPKNLMGHFNKLPLQTISMC